MIKGLAQRAKAEAFNRALAVWLYRLAAEAARRGRDLGIPVVTLFPYTDSDKRDERGSEAFNEGNLSPSQT